MDEFLASVGRIAERLPAGALIAIMVPASVVLVVVAVRKGWLDLKPAPLPPGDPAVDRLTQEIAGINRSLAELADLPGDVSKMAGELKAVQISLARMEGRMEHTTPPVRRR